MENRINISDETVSLNDFEAELFSCFPEEMHPTVKKHLPEFREDLVSKRLDIGSVIDSICAIAISELEYSKEDFKTVQKLNAIQKFVLDGGLSFMFYEREIMMELELGIHGLLASFVRYQEISDPEKAIVAFLVWKNAVTDIELSNHYELDTKWMYEPGFRKSMYIEDFKSRQTDFSRIFQDDFTH